MKRTYHHCDALEETPMWANITGSESVLFSERAADLMREPDAFKQAMQVVMETWPLSCEHNLSARSINRKAWLGHAGCYLSTGSPEGW